MVKKIFKILLKLVLTVLAVAILFLIYFNLPVKKPAKDAELGVTFSYRYAQDILLNWREAYLAMLDDLKVKKIRIPIYWDLVETAEGVYDFSNVDWQLEEAEKRNAEIILVVGQKVPRWPECAIPKWAENNDQKRKARLIEFISLTINRYKDGHPEIKYWQVENEPFLPFGICPEFDVNLLDLEIATVRKMDPTRKILLTDSGELSIWVRAAKRGDIFGTTLYRTIWKEGIGYYDYPIGPRFFQFKYWLIKIFARQKNAIIVELQTEPWINGWTTNQPLAEQFKSIDIPKFRDNIDYAQRVGFPEIYMWGVEWWYWLKVYQNHPEFWEEAKIMFSRQNQAGQRP